MATSTDETSPSWTISSNFPRELCPRSAAVSCALDLWIGEVSFAALLSKNQREVSLHAQVHTVRPDQERENPALRGLIH